MRVFRWLLSAACPVFALLSAAQNRAVTPSSIKDPKALLAAVAPVYDFTNPALKPWQFKASYQIYDQDGRAGEMGTYEYWWASPSVYRSTWTRGSRTESEWHTADGKRLETSRGDALHLFETEFPRELLAPLPGAKDENPKDTWLKRDTIALGKAKAPCVEIIGKRFVEQRGAAFPYTEALDNVKPPTYCFDPQQPILILKSMSAGVTESYGNFIGMQERDLPRSLVESVNGRRILAVMVNAIGGLDPADPALTPPADAKAGAASAVDVTERRMNGQRIEGDNPIYPDEAKESSLSGTVMIEAQIGKDGRIHGMEVISSPGPLLTASALKAVGKWGYKPYLLNGEPVEVRTTINVTYALRP
ncbi:MAG: energy transducer TonB [Acidobacteriaceae bacterium]